MKRSEYPDRQELVVIKVRRVLKYGAFVDLLEYDKEGFIHVSNVVSKWVKNIRSHIGEGQIRVAAAIRVNREKDLIDLSLRKVSSSQEKRKINEYKRYKRAEKLLERIAKKKKMPLDKAFEKVGWKLEDEFGELYAAFEAASAEGDKAFSGMEIPKDWETEIVALAEESVSVPSVSIKGTLKLKVYDGDGIATIKKILSSAISEDVKITYASAPDYLLTVDALDYPAAEKMLKGALDSIEGGLKGKDADFSFERQEK